MENKEQFEKTKLSVTDAEGTKDLQDDSNKSHSTDAVSSKEGNDKKHLGDLDEQIKGSDADMDQNVGKENNE
ncbi:hypothetical protein ACFOG5_06765 [Pedobacter fastidiosus]|uniref:Uncharacterized protein n=1 Tax=Pedobacter fastidiosus TaxID=2765361 RepID=A0ABR7KVA8_9SPHI|nr:hypothetical protein [Pedobacter fastidiosus]MBC6111864.1 hypothetical protein [Pedobacter fastidiosus]